MKIKIAIGNPEAQEIHEFVEVEAEPIEVAPHLPGWTFCIHEWNNGYRVSESSTGFLLSSGGTKGYTIREAVRKLKNVTPASMDTAIKRANEIHQKFAAAS